MRMQLLIIVLILAGCEPPKQVISDAEYEEAIAGLPGLTDECKRKLRRNDSVDPLEFACLQTMPPQRWKGVWNSGWEWSDFCAAPANECPVDRRNDEMWLQFADGAYPTGQTELEGTFEIEFIGRRTKVEGGYGHLDQYRHTIMVDKLIAIRRLEWPKN